MKRMLMLASVASMIEQFNMSNIELLKSMGYEVDVATNFKKGSTFGEDVSSAFMEKLKSMNIRPFQIDFDRNVFNLGADLKALKQVEKLVKENDYSFIHCHSPIGGVITRIAGHKYGVKVIYTAHGFHFFKGAPIKNWLIYYPIEKHYSRYTDTLITINHEDFDRASRKFHAKKVEYVPGIGVDTTKFSANLFSKEELSNIRSELGIPQDAIWLLSVGELNENKNHQIVINALGKLKQENPDFSSKIYYTVAGVGIKKDELNELSQSLGLNDHVKLLGFRKDVAKLCKAANIFVMPSHREGLSVALMEAMASSLPCIVSRIRGNTDLIDENGGCLFDSHSVENCLAALKDLCSLGVEKLKILGEYNRKKMKHFDIETVQNAVGRIYAEITADDVYTEMKGGASSSNP